MTTETILGVRFFNGRSRQAVDLISQTGGMVVAPAAPSMVNLCYDEDYRAAVASAEFAIADSGWMVLLWKLLTARSVVRISGLEYMKRLLEHDTVRAANAVMWVVPSPSARDKLVDLLRRREIPAAAENIYVAPSYARPMRPAGPAVRRHMAGTPAITADEPRGGRLPYQVISRRRVLSTVSASSIEVRSRPCRRSNAPRASDPIDSHIRSSFRQLSSGKTSPSSPGTSRT